MDFPTLISYTSPFLNHGGIYIAWWYLYFFIQILIEQASPILALII